MIMYDTVNKADHRDIVVSILLLGTCKCEIPHGGHGTPAVLIFKG